jgi:hypothetical protein
MAATENGVIDFTLMYATHNAFRRDLDRFAGASSADSSAPDRVAWENFKQQLHVHHTVEDTALWPRLQRAVADRPRDLELIDQMQAEHARLDPVLAAVDQAVTRRSAALADRVHELAAVLGEHMKHEEEAALPLIQEVLTAQDWGAFRSAMARRQGPRGAATYVPWIVDGVQPADRRTYLAVFPAPVRVLNRLFWEPSYQRRRSQRQLEG